VEIFELHPLSYTDSYELGDLGPEFSVFYHMDENGALHVYARTPHTKEVLSKRMDAVPVEAWKPASIADGKQEREWVYPFSWEFEFYAELKLKSAKSFFLEHSFHDPQSLLSSLPKNTLVAIKAKVDHRIPRKHLEKAMGKGTGVIGFIVDVLAYALGAGGSNGGNSQPDRLILSKIEGKSFFSLQILVFGRSEEDVEAVCAKVSELFNHPLSWKVKRVKRMEEKLNGVKTSMRNIHLASDALGTLLVLPDPHVVPVRTMRGAVLPRRQEARSGFFLGYTVGGRAFTIPEEKLFLHAYLLGGTGKGKSNTLAVLAEEVREKTDWIVVVIDPHNSFATDFACKVWLNQKKTGKGKLIYFDPIHSPISINPLALPQGSDRWVSELQGLESLLKMFERLFFLHAGATYVKFLITYALIYLYRVTPNPTFQDLYKTVTELRRGTLPPPPGLSQRERERWENEAKVSSQLEATSFASVFARLKLFVDNRLISKLFSTTSIKDEELIQPGTTVVVNTQEDNLGENASFLIAGAFLMKLWFISRTIPLSKRPRIVVFLDEAQKFAKFTQLDILLSEGRKYGLHIVLAHQHLGQFEEKAIVKSIMSNAGVKIIHQTVEEDAETVAKLDPDYSEKILRSVTTLPVGRALVIEPTLYGESATPPALVDVRKFQTVEEKDALFKEITEEMEKYKPPEEEEIQPVVLSFTEKFFGKKPTEIDPAAELAYQVTWLGAVSLLKRRIGKPAFYNAVKNFEFTPLLKKHNPDVPVTWVVRTVKKITGNAYTEARVYAAIGKLEKNKLVRRQGNRLYLLQAPDENPNFSKNAPSRNGNILMNAAYLFYTQQGYVVRPTLFQVGKELPDMVAIPVVDKKGWLDFQSAISVEIESPQEVQRHPEQLHKNVEKAGDFKEVHIWCMKNDRWLIESLLQEGDMVKIFTPEDVEFREYEIKEERKEATQPEETQQIPEEETQQTQTFTIEDERGVSVSVELETQEAQKLIEQFNPNGSKVILPPPHIVETNENEIVINKRYPKRKIEALRLKVKRFLSKNE
jgi:DNA helicase HerA-like ATPase